MTVTGWKLNHADRAALLRRFPPEWPDVIADHVTLDVNAGPQDICPQAAPARIVGSVNDGEGLQAMVVSIGGKTDRPDGSTYHITWSIDRARGRKPADSNLVIAMHGWRPLEEPIPVRLETARW